MKFHFLTLFIFVLFLCSSNPLSAAPTLDYQIPVYRVEITPGEWDAAKIQYEAGLRDIAVEALETAAGTRCYTSLNCEYTGVYKLRDRMKLAGFNAEVVTTTVDYQTAKQDELFPPEAFATFTDLGEYTSAESAATAQDVAQIHNTLTAKEAEPDITTSALVDYLAGQMPVLLAAEQSGNAEASFLAGKYYYLRGLAETKTRMEKYQQVGFRVQKFEPLTSVENRSYLTALQHFQECAKQESLLQEKALYHCAAALYGIRDQGDQQTRIPQVLAAYQQYAEQFPNGQWTKRAAMNIVGLEFELHRMDRTRSIEPTIALAHDIFLKGKESNSLGYEELRSALMMMEMLSENGNSDAALGIFYSTFNSLDTETLAESLYSTYSTALECAAGIYGENQQYEKAIELLNKIKEVCKKDNHFLRGTSEDNIIQINKQIESFEASINQ